LYQKTKPFKNIKPNIFFLLFMFFFSMKSNMKRLFKLDLFQVDLIHRIGQEPYKWNEWYYLILLAGKRKEICMACNARQLMKKLIQSLRKS